MKAEERAMDPMDKIFESRILDAEERLRRAMIASDVQVLDELLAPDLVFTNHLGQLFGKKDDLAAHKAHIFTIQELKLSEQKVKIHNGVAIVTVRAKISGAYEGNLVEDDIRFTRILGITPTRPFLTGERKWPG